MLLILIRICIVVFLLFILADLFLIKKKSKRLILKIGFLVSIGIICISFLTSTILSLFCVKLEKVEQGRYDILQLEIDSKDPYYIYKDTEKDDYYGFFYHDGYAAIPLKLKYDKETFYPKNSEDVPYIIIYKEFYKADNDLVEFLLQIPKNPVKSSYNVYVNENQILEIKAKHPK